MAIRKSTDIVGRQCDATDWDNNFQIVIDALITLAGKVNSSLLNAANGVPTLNNDLKVIQTALNADKINGYSVTDLLTVFAAVSEIGVANGIAQLDSGAKLPLAQMPDISDTINHLTEAPESDFEMILSPGKHFKNDVTSMSNAPEVGISGPCFIEVQKFDINIRQVVTFSSGDTYTHSYFGSWNWKKLNN